MILQMFLIVGSFYAGFLISESYIGTQAHKDLSFVFLMATTAFLSVVVYKYGQIFEQSKFYKSVGNLVKKLPFIN